MAINHQLGKIILRAFCLALRIGYGQWP